MLLLSLLLLSCYYYYHYYYYHVIIIIIIIIIPLLFHRWPRLLLLRPNEVDDYQPKMTELEKAGVWENLCKKEIPYWSREDMQNHGPGFVYKVLKKWTKNRISFNNWVARVTSTICQVLYVAATIANSFAKIVKFVQSVSVMQDCKTNGFCFLKGAKRRRDVFPRSAWASHVGRVRRGRYFAFVPILTLRWLILYISLNFLYKTIKYGQINKSLTGFNATSSPGLFP